MNHYPTTCLLIVILLTTGLFTLEAKPQGCSDAEICTVHSMLPEQEVHMDSAIITNNTLNAGLVFGMSQWDVLAFTPSLEYSRRLGQNFSLTGRFTCGFKSGEPGDINGPADFFLNFGNTFHDHFTRTGGVKIPVKNFIICKSIPTKNLVATG